MATVKPANPVGAGKFACFPLRFLFGKEGDNDKLSKPVKPVGVSEATTDSYTGSSSMMSVGDTSEDAKLAQQGAVVNTATTVQRTGQNVPGVRTIAKYEILDTLGKGMSGKVKRGYDRTIQQQVALKIIDKQNTPRRVLQMLGTEIAAMKALNQHPHILHLLHYDMAATYPRKKGGTRDVVLLALDLAEGGELFDFMMYTGAFSEAIAKAIFSQLTSALAFCHERGIYHRDIKPENLLLDDNYQLKVADFGLAAMRASTEELLKTECGTRSYMAPEVLARQQYDGAKADCWSAGVVLFIMLSGNPPFQMARAGDWWFNQFTENRPDRFWKSHKRYTPDFPEPAQDLLTRIFAPNPANRPTVTELLKEPWLQSASLSHEEVRQELISRKQKIFKEKEAEKERAKKKKAAGQYGKSGKADFDPDSVKHRDIGMPGASSFSLPLDEPTAPTAHKEILHNITNLYTAEGPITSVSAVKEALELMGAKVSGKGDYHLRALVPVENLSNVEIDIKVYTIPEDTIQVIHVTRTQGDLLSYQKIFRTLKGNTVGLHGEEEADPVLGTPVKVGPVPLNPDEMEVGGEEALDQSVGMI